MTDILEARLERAKNNRESAEYAKQRELLEYMKLIDHCRALAIDDSDDSNAK